MSFAVKEIFYSLQGEGANTGRPAVFCRFSGCNLWTGREEDRVTSACRFCDTDFVGTSGTGGGRYASATELAAAIVKTWRGRCSGVRRFVIFTGGEPTLQLTEELIGLLHAEDFEVAIETNGTRDLPSRLDWVCVSPKGNTKLRVTAGNELKLVFPQEGVAPARFEEMQFSHFFLQPMDGPAMEQNRKLAVQHCLENPRWRLSLQTHKILGII